MILKFRTKIDKSGNFYTIEVNQESKTYIIDYNNRAFHDCKNYITKRTLNSLENDLIKAGFERLL